MDKLKQAIATLSEAGAVFSIPPGRHLSLAQAGARLDCSAKYLREHLREFPNAWRLPGGEIRIPERDVDALADRGKLRRMR
jgi:hypothetical protein